MHPYIKRDKKIIKSDDTEIEQYKFHQNKSLVSMNNIDINEMVVYNQPPFSKQEYIIGYKDD